MGAHISVVQDELPTRPALWNDREGRPMRFRLLYPPQSFAEYVFFPVECEDALYYREALGLPRAPRWPLHPTFGNRKATR